MSNSLLPLCQCTIVKKGHMKKRVIIIFKEVLLFVKSVKETHYTYKEHIEVSIIVYIQMLQCIILHTKAEMISLNDVIELQLV